MTPIPPLDRTSPTFRAEVDTLFQTRIPLLVTEANQLETQLEGAANSAAAAAASASAAKVAADAAAYVAGAAKWVSGTSYADGAAVWSPINKMTYRRRSAGSGATDPSADGANWTGLIENGFTNLVVISTTGTWQPPAGTTKVKVTVVDGGQGGFTASFNGGNGGAASVSVLDVSSTTTYSLTIGAGGNSGDPPTGGGTSSFSGSGVTTRSGTVGTLLYPGNLGVPYIGGASRFGGFGRGGNHDTSGTAGGIIIEY